MSKRFDSVIASPLGGLVRSPLGVRETGVSKRAVYVECLDYRIVNNSQHYDEKLFRLSLEDLSNPIVEARPPWWPSSHPTLGQRWFGDVISGDADTVWYSAFDLVKYYDLTATPDPRDTRWVIDIFKLTGNLELIRSWRWHQPAHGGGRIWHITPFGDSTVLWGLAFVHEFPQPNYNYYSQEMYLVELDPETMQIRRISSDLWSGLTTAQRRQRPFVWGGGGTSSVIWVALTYIPDFPDLTTQRSLIREYSPVDFALVRQMDAPRSRNTGDSKRVVTGIGGDSQSIWISSSSVAFGTIPGSTAGRARISELPFDFSNENRTFLQEEIQAPWRYPIGIG